MKTIKRTSTSTISQRAIELLNYRIEQEEFSSRMYHAMSIWLNDNGFMGAAKAWQKDADDEMVHASWAKEYLLDMGIKPEIPGIAKPPQDFQGLPDVIRKSYAHEVLVTKQCNELAKEALSMGDHLLYQLALKYLSEQQEELGRLKTNLDQLEAFGETKDVLMMLDEQFGEPFE